MSIEQGGQSSLRTQKNTCMFAGWGQRCQQKTKMIEGDRLIAPFSTRREGKDDDHVKCN